MVSMAYVCGAVLLVGVHLVTTAALHVVQVLQKAACAKHLLRTAIDRRTAAEQCKHDPVTKSRFSINTTATST
jgi:uncharacterized protein (DUF3084 family)